MNWLSNPAKDAELSARAQLRLGPLRQLRETPEHTERITLKPASTELPATVSSAPPVRINPGRSGTLVLLVLAVALGVVAVLWWQFWPKSEPVPLVTPAVPSASTPTQLVVAVSGAVHKPGLVRLAPGSRVADAIEAAGGLLPEAQTGNLNLARKLRDGELIAVAGPGAPPDGATSSGELVDLNTATLAQLDELPGVGPVLAQRIIDYRAKHGGFASVSDLSKVDGVGETRFARLKELVTV